MLRKATLSSSGATTRFTRAIALASRRHNSTASQSSNGETREGCLFVDSVFPIQLARWDFRHYIGLFRQETLLGSLERCIDEIKSHNFRVIAIEPQRKDGGVFVRFQYTPGPSETSLADIEAEAKEALSKHGGSPTWNGIGSGDIWLVKGSPWREDLDRYPSPILQVKFDGPDVQEQTLYQLFRPYGRIQDLTYPAAVPAGTLRFATITYKRVHSAAVARNVIHGFTLVQDDQPQPAGSKPTKLRLVYQRPVQAHVVRDWMANHPKIMIPLVVFLLGTLTYTVFDPIRSFMVQGKLLDWFDWRESKLYKWVRVNTIGRISFGSNKAAASSVATPQHVWKERDDVVGAVRGYLMDPPGSVAFVHGPQGSGKTKMIQEILQEQGRTTLVIDCRELQKATSETHVIASLANQTGYRPVFTFLNSMNNLIDLASVGLIGQKAGLNSSLADQLQQILNVVANGLKGVANTHRSAIKQRIQDAERRQIQEEQDEQRRDAIRTGIWHDGRLDCVAGNGVMSELGVGDESLMDQEIRTTAIGELIQDEEQKHQAAKKQKTKAELDAIKALPVVLIRNYASKLGSSHEEILTVIAKWAAMLSENQIAHVIVVSDNRENSKELAKALPSKPLVSVALSDADSSSSVSYVKQKLQEAELQVEFSSEELRCIERLGGRASELESLIHRVRNGQKIREAVEEIIGRGVEELRKNAFGDDIEDAKSLPWTREQVWAVIKLLAREDTAPYHDVLQAFPFKGDEKALRSLEHADLISVGTKDGRASSIRAGKPVLKWVYKRIVQDNIFRATQDLAFNDLLIAGHEKTIRTCEDELKTIHDISPLDARPWWAFWSTSKSATASRAKYLMVKMLTAEKQIESLEKQNKELKSILAKGDKS